MNICGVLVHANPAKAERVVAELAAMPGVEVHEVRTDPASTPPDDTPQACGRIVITVEDTQGVLALDTLGRIHRTDGIVAAALVYHHFDAESAAAQHHTA